MKNYFIAILLLANTYTSYSQADVKTKNNLKQLFAPAKQDTGRVLLLIVNSKKYMDSKPDTALLLAQLGYKSAKQIKFVRGEALSLKAIGAVYGVTGNYPKGLETLLHSLMISESINDKQGMMVCLVTIGVNYSHQHDYKQSLVYFYKAKKIADDIHDNRYLLISLLDIGDSYENLNRLDSALFVTRQCYEIANRFNNIPMRGIALNNLGNIHAKMGKDEMSMEYYRQSIPDLVSDNDDEVICEATLGMANLFMKTGQQDSALLYAQKSLTLAQQDGFTQRVLNAGNFLSVYYEKLHLIEQAYAFQKITIAAKDSLFSQEKVRELQNLSFAEQIRQQEITGAKAEAIEARKKNIQMAAIGAFIPVFLGTVLLLRRRKTKPRTLAFMGLLGLLMMFEFITMLIHSYIEEWTHHTPVFMLLMLMAVASVLVPFHHKLEHWVKEKLSHKKLYA